MFNEDMFNDLERYIGQTVTVFTASGGLSGNGFTGVLASINCNSIRLITGIGMPPSYPVNTGFFNNMGNQGSCAGRGQDSNYYSDAFNGSLSCGNFLGSVTEIPVNRIVSFTHNAI